MSDTPRTDSMEPYGPPYNGEESGLIHVPKAFARQLERELNQAQADLGAVQYELDVWHQCAELLANALRCANNSYAGGPGGQMQIDQALAVFEKLKGETK